MNLYEQCQTFVPGLPLNPPSAIGLVTPSVNLQGPKPNDVINSPNHYARGKFEVWDIIEYFKLNYNIGNVCKYILRAGVKTDSPLEDYKKARAYLDREIAILEGRIDVRPK